MRKFQHLAAICAVLAAFSVASFAQEVHTDWDRKAVFERYHTYSWAKVQTTNPLWEDRIKDAVDKVLQSKGWQKVDSDGDVALVAVGVTDNEREYQTFYNTLGGGWLWGGFDTVATTTVQTYQVGTLVIDMYDTKTKRLIWRGTASDTLSKDPQKNEGKLEKAVEKMFKNFPPRENKS